MNKLDPDVEKLESWAKSMNLTSDQYNTLSAIVEVTVKNKLKEVAEHLLTLTSENFRAEKIEMIEEKKNKSGIWSN